MDAKLAQLIGFCVGDGSVRNDKNHKCIRWFCVKRDLDFVVSNLKALGWNYKVSLWSQRGVREVNVYDRDKVNLFWAMGLGQPAWEKKIPVAVKGLEVAFLQGLYLADGHKRKNGSVVLVTVSCVLAQEVKDVLNDLEVLTSVYCYKDNRKETYKDRFEIYSGVSSGFMRKVGFAV